MAAIGFLGIRARSIALPLSILLAVVVGAYVFFPSARENVGFIKNISLPVVVKERVAPRQKLVTDHISALSPLDQVLYLMDSRYFEKAALSRVSIGATFDTQEEEAKPKKTWSEISSGEAKKNLSKAKKISGVLVKSLDYEGLDISTALKEFQKAIDVILTEKSRKAGDTPESALARLESLQYRITGMMFARRVPRADLVRWSQVSLAPALANTRTDQILAGSLPRFDDRLRLTNVYLTRSPKGIKPPVMSIRLTLGSTEAERVQIFRNGIELRDFKLPATPMRRGEKLRKLAFQYRDARGEFTFKITDIKGYVFIKSYEFFPRADAFDSSKSREFRYKIPYDEYDIRLDRYFLAKKRALPKAA